MPRGRRAKTANCPFSSGYFGCLSASLTVVDDQLAAGDYPVAIGMLSRWQQEAQPEWKGRGSPRKALRFPPRSNQR